MRLNAARRSLSALLAIASLVLTETPARAQGDLAVTLSRVGAYVEDYLARVQRIVGQEAVALQPLTSSFGVDGRVRTLVYDLRLDWNGESATRGARVMRELVRVDGRPPRPGDEPRCLDPRSVTPEPLEFLLPAQQERMTFRAVGTATIDKRRMDVIEYRGRGQEPVEIEWKDDCASVELPGRTRGRVWVDQATAAVVRLDEGLTGLVDLPVPPHQQRRGASTSMTIERADTSIRYRAVRFDGPDEVLWLPDTIVALTVIRNAGTPRLRVMHRFSNYRRFVAEGRIVP